MKKNHQIGVQQKIISKEQNVLNIIMLNVDTFKYEYISTLAANHAREQPIIIIAIFGNMNRKNIFISFLVACSLIIAFCLK